MATVNVASINAKVDAWVASKKGQARIKKTLDDYRKKGVERTKAGSRVLTNQKMKLLADKLADEVVKAGNGAGLPASVASVVASLKRGAFTDMGDGARSIELSFMEDKNRPSLQPDKYGSVNIVAIFNNGYPLNGTSPEAIASVVGEWHGMENVHALGQREGSHFLQQAVSNFNATYGREYGVTVTLDGIYNET